VRVLSIDPGIINCGFAVFEGEKLLSSGCIRTTPPVYAQLFRELSALCKKYLPDLAVVEGAFQRSRYANPHIEAVGIIKAVLELEGVKRTTYAPSSWRKVLLGKGRANKKETMLFLSQQGYRIKTTHEADALALALTYLIEKGGKEQ